MEAPEAVLDLSPPSATEKLERLTEALLAYVQGQTIGLMPRINALFTRELTDLPFGAGIQWTLRLALLAVEKIEDDGTAVCAFTEEFQGEGMTMDDAIDGVTREVRYFLRTQRGLKEAAIAAVDMAFARLETPVPQGDMWAHQDPAPIVQEEESTT